MSSRTYYDILGVSRDATLEEITSAKNALAKVYHPDANMHKDIDINCFYAGDSGSLPGSFQSGEKKSL